MVLKNIFFFKNSVLPLKVTILIEHIQVSTNFVEKCEFGGDFSKSQKIAFFGHPIIFRIWTFFLIFRFFRHLQGPKSLQNFFYLSKSSGSEVRIFQKMSSSMWMVKSSFLSWHQNNHWYRPSGGRWVYMQKRIPIAALEAEILKYARLATASLKTYFEKNKGFYYKPKMMVDFQIGFTLSCNFFTKPTIQLLFIQLLQA